MEKLSILIIIWTICTYSAECKPLTQSVSFPIPTTFLTPTPRRMQCPHKRSTNYKRIFLNDDQMQELYLELLGSMDQGMFAKTLTDAEANFHHILLPSSSNKTKHWRRKNHTKKSDFINDLKIYQSWYNSMVKDLTVSNDTIENADAPLYHDFKDELEDILAKIDITKNQLKQELGLIHDIDELTAFRLSNTKRIKRGTNTIGAIRSRTEYCHNRGRPTGTNYLHLCTTCAVTTQFPEDIFPRYTNEIKCDPTDCKCFQATKTIVHGKCQPIIKNVIMLRRNPGGCRMTIKNGQEVFTDDFEMYQQPLHVGCECVLNKNSLYAPLVPKH
ncbi:uncharacterized protein LOC132728935 [Ruditapes philippinarum]|uniref:uncharacterized protein LOC132728935 n=1 Tax=Ruditapes philippinarum TaxID=129788 RepID=UPI00295A661E|nr:uncharacterized protein LOC132728935 [Ruditapes philippinarum]